MPDCVKATLVDELSKKRTVVLTPAVASVIVRFTVKFAEVMLAPATGVPNVLNDGDGITVSTVKFRVVE